MAAGAEVGRAGGPGFAELFEVAESALEGAFGLYTEGSNRKVCLLSSVLYRGAASCVLLTAGLLLRFPSCLFAGAPKPVTLTVAGLGYETVQRLADGGLDEFTRRTGVRVEFVPSWGTSAEQLAVISRSLNRHFATPDVYRIDMIWPATLERHLLDLAPYLDQDAREQMPELLRNDIIGGRVVSLPLYLNVGMLYYRTDLLRKYGYRHPPETWQELEKMAARIQRGERAAGNAHFWGYVWQGSAYEGLTCNALEWQASFGAGHIIELDRTVSVNNARTLECLRMAAGWIGWISPPSVLAYREADSLSVFRSGNAAFLRYWSSGYGATSSAGSAVRGRFDVALLPAGPNGRAQVMGGFQMAVSRYSEHPREAAELVLYLASGKRQKIRAMQEGYLPSIPKLFLDPDVQRAVPEARVLAKAGAKSWVMRPSNVAGDQYLAVSKAYYGAVHRILSRQCKAEEALAALQKYLLSLNLKPQHSDK